MTNQSPKPLVVAGVMSGTSADGVDVALCRISPARDNEASPRLKLLGYRSFAYSKRLRAGVLSVAAGEPTTAAALSQLSWHLGQLYAACIASTTQELKLKPQLAAIHGQTVYHQPQPSKFLGVPVRCTLQIGEASPIAERLKIPVVSDFRPADLVANGQGAPLVPMLDFCLFRHTTRNRLLLNLGGIANITALPANCAIDAVLAFDTGPANMAIDALMQRLFNRRFDRNGSVAARGAACGPVLQQLLKTTYFQAAPPKSCGREEFGAAFAQRIVALCNRERVTPADIIATATALTSSTIVDAYRRFCWPHIGQHAPLARGTDLIVAGGGANNATLMNQITAAFHPLGIRVMTTDASGIPMQAKEAAAFALLGWLTWHQLPGNVPSATGAAHPAVLGKVTYASA